MSIDTLEDWNQRLGACGCCPMPECPAPDGDWQAASRTLTAMTGSASSYSIGVPSLQYGTDPGEVPPVERFVLYQFMRVTDTLSINEIDEVRNESKVVTLNKEPPIMERNRVGVPAIIGAVTRVIGSDSGSWTFYFTEDDGNGGLQRAGVSDQGSYSGSIDDTATPFGGATGPGTESYTSYDEDGNVVDSDTYAITVGYGPAWFNFLNPDTVNTSINGGLLKHEVSDDERSLTVEFLDPHTTQTARDAIVPPPVEPEEWSTKDGLLPSSFSVSYVDEENGDTRLTGASCRRVRFRWRVPEDFEGSYFKLVWDEVFFPDGWDATIDDPDWQPPDPLPDPPPDPPQVPDPNAPTPQLLRHGELEWQGPGDPEDPDSWIIGDWQDLEIPQAVGEVRVVNVGVVCYRSPFGTKPTMHGERWSVDSSPEA